MITSSRWSSSSFVSNCLRVSFSRLGPPARAAPPDDETAVLATVLRFPRVASLPVGLALAISCSSVLRSVKSRPQLLLDAQRSGGT